MAIKSYLFSNVPLLMQKMPYAHSFVLGIWVKYGSRYEELSKNGISHFLEHLFFQGTKNRDAKSISIEIDSIGGDINAFTTREFTAIYIKALAKHIETAIELICDIFSNPTFPENEVEKERTVILDEIRTISDTPEELVHDLFMEHAFQGGLGQPILGKEATVLNITREDIVRCYDEYYSLSNCVISCAGNFDEKVLFDYLEKNLIFRNSKKTPDIKPSIFTPSLNVYEEDFNEVHITIGMDTFSFNNPYRYPLTLLNSIIGGSVSSKLFQEIREKRGLAYNIYSSVSFYHDTGLFEIYTACDQKKINEILSIIMDIFKNLPDSLTEEELQRAKTQIVSQILFSLESSTSIMNNLAYQELYSNTILSPEEYTRKIESVTLKDICEVASMLKEKKPGITLLGPIKKEAIDLDI